LSLLTVPTRAGDRPEISPDGRATRRPLRVRPALALAVVVGLGIGLRLWSFSPMWLDEAQTVAIAKVPLSDLHATLRTDGAPPLYYLLLHGWMNLFGDGVWAARSLSMLCSILCLPALWFVARRLGGSRELAAIAVALFASNPWAVRYAGEARMYSLVALEVLLGMLAMERLRRRGDFGSAIAVSVLTASLLLTHYWAIFLLVNVGAAVLIVALCRPAERRFAIRAGLSGVLGVVIFLPWLPTMLYQSAHTGAPWAARPDFGTLVALPIDWSGGFGPAGLCASIFVIPLLTMALFARRNEDGSVIFGVRPGMVTAVVAAIVGGTLLTALVACLTSGGGIVARYTAVIVPLVILLLAHGIMRMPRAAGAGALAVLVGLGLATDTTIAKTPHSQAGHVADVLNLYAGYGDLMIYCPDQLAPALEPRLRVVGVSRLELPSERNPAVVDWTNYGPRLASFNPRATMLQITRYLRMQYDASVWFVNGPGYRTHRDVCGPLRDRLIATLGRPTVMYNGLGRGYEKESLERFAGSKLAATTG